MDDNSYEIIVNRDSVDLEHIILEDDSPALMVTSMDINGEPTHHAYNLDSLVVMISDLTIAQETLFAVTSNDDYVI